MSDGLPGYDACKLATPPEYENDDPCEHCNVREANETIRAHRDRPMRRLCRECADEWVERVERLSEEDDEGPAGGLDLGGSPGCAGGLCEEES